jgi:PleD family two-component response regulator
MVVAFVEVTRTADAMMYEAERSGKDQHRLAMFPAA